MRRYDFKYAVLTCSKIFKFQLDIDECESNPCGKGEKCQNLNGKYRCIKLIICSRGYEINEAGDSCVGKNVSAVLNYY